jgi:rhomboid family GlyGly-CTERM serine protease
MEVSCGKMTSAPASLVSRAGRVWATLAIAAVAALVLSSPALAAWLIYDRALLLQGQLWRGWTGHVVHFGPSHLVWDLAVLLPAGCWLEYLWPARARWFYLGCPLAISAALMILEPTLLRYAGLSGLATGALVLLAGLQLRFGQNRPAWPWSAVLVLVAAKLVHELITGAPLMVSDFGDNIRSVTLAHLGGAVCGAVFVCLSATTIRARS